MNLEQNEVGQRSVPPPQNASQFLEGPIARKIEEQTARLPSDIFLWGAVAAMGVSLVSQLGQPRRMTMFNIPTRRGQLALFVGQWVPTLLLFGLYNKLVKVVGGSDSVSASGNGQQH